MQMTQVPFAASIVPVLEREPLKTPHFRTRLDYMRDHSEGIASFKTDITFFYDGDTTEARVTLHTSSGDQFYGEDFTTLAPGDHYDRKTGEQLALVRAMLDAFTEAEAYLLSKTQTEDEYRAEEDAAQRSVKVERFSPTKVERFAPLGFVAPRTEDCTLCYPNAGVSPERGRS